MLLNCGFVEHSWQSLSCKEIKPVNPKENQSWIFIGRTDIEAEAPILWPPDVKSWLIWKDPDPGKDWKWEEKGMKENEMVAWHHWHDAHEFEQALGVGDGQGSLVCCSPWGHKELDTIERLNWTDSHGLRERGWQNVSSLSYKNLLNDYYSLVSSIQSRSSHPEPHWRALCWR